MSNHNNMNEELTPIEEQALDALLSEVHGNSAPPDLTDEILAQLHQVGTKASSPPEIVCADDSAIRRSVAPITPARRRTTIAMAVITALAATVFLAFTIHRSLRIPSDQTHQLAIGPAQPDHADSIVDQTPPESPDELLPEQELAPKSPRPRQGIPLVVDTPSTQPAAATEDDPSWLVPQKPSSSVALTLVSADVADGMQKYWQAIGIEPSAEAGAAQVASRVAAAIGIELAADVMGDPQAIQDQLRRPAVAKAIARRWLAQWTQGGIGRVEKKARQQLIDQLSEGFRSQQSFDRMLAGWTSGKSPQSSAFYTALATGGEHQMVRRLASLTMNVDLRCVQCHDSYIEGTKRQEDYWAFAAFLRHGVKRERDRWKVDAAKGAPKPFFYSLPDGRQAVAEPALPDRWLHREEPIDNVSDFSGALVGSRELAGGIVNSLWKLVHGQPLQGQVIDTITSPHHESLDQLRQRLTNDVLESKFDLGRTLALIIASPATSRSVPEALLPENMLASTDAEVDVAMQSVNAFAASLPVRAALPLDRRIDLAMQRIGAKIDGVQPVLAQGNGETSPSPNAPMAKRPKPGSDFPGKAGELPVQWLSQVKDQRSRAEHLGYLAGMVDIPEKLSKAVDELQAADEDAELALQRVWWLVRP